MSQIVTVRSTAFEAAVPADGTCDTEVLTAPADLPAVSEYVGQELTKSDRPDLSSAKVCSFKFLISNDGYDRAISVVS